MRDFLQHLIRHPRALLPGAPRGIIGSARAWVAQQQAQVPADIRRGPPAAVWEVDPCSLVSLPPPQQLTGSPRLPAQRLFPIPATALYFLRGARVIGTDAAVISPDNRVFAEFTYVDDAGGIDQHSLFKRRRFPAAKALPGWYATLSYPSAFAYFHWLVECLPRVRLLEPHLDALDGVFVPANLAESMRDALIALGLRREQLLPMEISSHFAPEHLLVPNYCAGLDFPNWVPKYLRARVLGETDATPRGTRRIYLSRARTSKRRLLNESELLAVLARHGVDVVHAQEFSFIEQARLFADSQLIVGPSGAALTNAVFARPGAALVCLQPDVSMGPHVFYSLAAAAGLDYWDIAGAPSSKDTPVEHADFLIDAAAVDRLLEAAILRLAKSEGRIHARQ